MKPTRAGTKWKIQARLERHAELMAALEAKGMSRDQADTEALNQLLDETEKRELAE